jgi:CBS domain-containing protein
MSIVQQGLLAQGGRMQDIWALMSSFRDTLTRRLMVLAIEEMRKLGQEPPVLEFCWMTFGTPGRRETLLSQNFLEGFVYKDPEKDQTEEALAYVSALAEMVKEGLVACGLLDKKHGQVLSIPEAKWKELFKFLPDKNALLKDDRLRLFDMRGLCEGEELAHQFREHVIEAVQQERALLDRMRASNDASRVPTCFYRDKVVTATGLKERINLKNDVLTPLVSAVRLLCLEKGIGDLSTKDRIEALSDMGTITSERAKDLTVIYPWLVETCLERALDRGEPIDWMLDPRQCSSEKKRLLTDSFRIVKETVEMAS